MRILSLYQARVGTGLPGRMHHWGPRVATALHKLEKKSGAPGGTMSSRRSSLFVPLTFRNHISRDYTHANRVARLAGPGRDLHTHSLCLNMYLNIRPGPGNI